MTIEDLERDVRELQQERQDEKPAGRVIKAANALLQSLSGDVGQHGGLITRDTIRLGDELRLVINRVERELANG
jgi:hypothetical protein